MKQFLVRLDDEMAEELRKTAFLERVTKTDIVREAIEARLRRGESGEARPGPDREDALLAAKYLLKVAALVNRGWTLRPPADDLPTTVAANGSAPASPERTFEDGWSLE